MVLVPKAKKLADSAFTCRINRELWQSFREFCDKRELNTTEVLVEYIKYCVDNEHTNSHPVNIELSVAKIENLEITLNQQATAIKELTDKVDAMETKFSEFVKERDNELLF